MSNLMTEAVISMPFELAMADDLSRRQFYDCARLEAALGLDVVWFFSSVCIKQIFFHISISTQYSDHNGDKQAARRMASVRAAAEIGREMK